MQDITQLMTRYRDCVLDVWNRYFVPRSDSKDKNLWADYDEHDLWADACIPLFRALVLYPLERESWTIHPEYWYEPAPKARFVPFIHVEPTTEADIQINRSVIGKYPSSGNWDWSHPTSVGKADCDLRFHQFFDWDCLGNRSFEFVQVLILESKKYPEAVQRYALIRSDEVRYLFDEHEESQ